MPGHKQSIAFGRVYQVRCRPACPMPMSANTGGDHLDHRQQRVTMPARYSRTSALPDWLTT